MRFAFIEWYRRVHPVLMMCRLLRASRSGFYAWRRRPESARTRENRKLLAYIRAIHRRRRQVYGSPRIHAELRAMGWGCGRHRVARLMRDNGVRVRMKRRFRVTTQSRHSHPVAANLLERQFTARRPNEIWAADITYVWTREGWLYLAVVMDVFSRRIVGWSLKERLTAELAVEALQMALWCRKPPRDLIHHSDRGSQYASSEYGRLLARHGIVPSMSRAGDCWDNAMVESLFGRFKSELIHLADFETRAQGREEIFEYIEAFYNRQRRHSSLGYVSPAEYERRATAAPLGEGATLATF